MSEQRRATTEHERIERALARVREALRGLSFGEVTLVVHDGDVVQLQRVEKIRFGGSERP